MLMSTWLANCQIAVMQFLSVPTNIPFVSFYIANYLYYIKYLFGLMLRVCLVHYVTFVIAMVYYIFITNKVTQHRNHVFVTVMQVNYKITS